MNYLFILFWSNGFFWCLLFWIISEGSVFLEEKEHLVFALVSAIIILFILPSQEKGILIWSNLTLVFIITLLSVSSPVWVYILFEVSLIPIVVIILGWGTQPERVSAVYHLFLYTFIFSSPFLITVVLLENTFLNITMLLSLFITISFIVNLPLYLLHIWLPNAHVEAPTVGSIILAGILLNIGAIGFLWAQNYCLAHWNLFWFYCALWGSAFSAFVCSLQSDTNSLVAYSSIAHINYTLVVICLSSLTSDSSSSVLLLSHSFISSVLLFLAGSCFHILSSRMVYFIEESFLLKSIVVLILICIITSNFSVPPSIGLLGEAPAFIVNFSKLWGASLCIIIYLFFVSYYCMLLGLSFCGSNSNVFFEKSALFLCFFIALSLLNLVYFSLY